MKNYFVDLDTQALYSKNQKTLEKTQVVPLNIHTCKEHETKQLCNVNRPK